MPGTPGAQAGGTAAPALRAGPLWDPRTQHYLVLRRLQEAGADRAVRGQVVFHPQDGSVAPPRPGGEGGMGGGNVGPKTNSCTRDWLSMVMAPLCFSETSRLFHFHPAQLGGS